MTTSPATRPAPPAGPDLERKAAALDGALRDLPSLIVAYSGGVDSAYLAYAAHRALGAGALAVTADSPSYPERHRALALRLARDFGFNHLVIRTAEMARPEYRANPANRCYYCKHELYTHLVGARARARHSRRSPTAATPTIAATIARAGRRRASSASGARSTRPG